LQPSEHVPTGRWVPGGCATTAAPPPLVRAAGMHCKASTLAASRPGTKAGACTHLMESRAGARAISTCPNPLVMWPALPPAPCHRAHLCDMAISIRSTPCPALLSTSASKPGSRASQPSSPNLQACKTSFLLLNGRTRVRVKKGWPAAPI
jgi:hypothetical protein